MSNNTNAHLRLLGTVWSDETATTLLGYVIIDTREQLPRMTTLTIAQTQNLLANSVFENASLENGEVHSTECSMDRLPRYNQRGQVFANEGYMVVARLTSSVGNTRGFRLVTSRGEILNVAYETLMSQVEDNSIFLINAKTTTRNNTKFISAIRSEFKEIQLGAKNTESTSPETVPTRTNTPEYHANYLRKLLARVAKSGFIRGNYALRSPKTKDYSIFYKEFLKVEYPELAQHARHDIGWTQVISVMLLMANGVAVPKYAFPNINDERLYGTKAIRVVKKVKTNENNHKRTDTYYKQLNIGRVSDELLQIVRQYDTTGDVCKTLTLYNKVYDGKLVNGEPVYQLSQALINGVKHPVLRSFLSRLENETNKPSKRKQVEHFVYDTEELDYFSEDGVEKLGLTLDPKRDGKKVNSPLYRPIVDNAHSRSGGVNIRYVFDGLNLTQGQIEELTELGNCYGDFNIFRMLADIQEERKTFTNRSPEMMALYTHRIETMINFYVYVLSVHNQGFAKLTVLYLGLQSDIVFDPDTVYQATNRSDKLFYNSGLRFGTKAELTRGQSFSRAKTNYVPKRTRVSFNGFMEESGHSYTVPSNRIPRFSNLQEEWNA